MAQVKENQITINNYTFTPGAAGVGTIVFNDYTSIEKERICFISNLENGNEQPIYAFAESGYNCTVAGNVITLEVDTTGMANNQLRIKYIQDDVSQDVDLQAERIVNLTPEWAKYTDPESLIDTQDLTDNFVDFGPEIDMRGYNRLGLFIIGDVNDSQNVDLRILAKHEFNGVDEYSIINDLENGEVRLWDDTSNDIKIYREFEINGAPILQIQAKAEVVGTTPGDLSLDIVKSRG